jgi:HlyD family secretion protein
MNPEMKVYQTQVAIEGTNDWTKPGMSAKVEILVNTISDCIYIPLQAVTSDRNQQVCYIPEGSKPERRVIETGEFNDNFIAVTKGLREGERVLLRLPESTETEGNREEEKPATQDASAPPGKTPTKKAESGKAEGKRPARKT